jgi:hypothetical protein
MHGFYDGMWANSFHSPPTIAVQEYVGADTRLFEAKVFGSSGRPTLHALHLTVGLRRAG